MCRIKQKTFKEPSDLHTLVDEPLVIHQRRGQNKAKELAIFVHGLGGVRYGRKPTWGHLPALVFTTFPKLHIGMYSYRTLFRRFIFWKSVRLEDEAVVLGGLLRNLSQYDSFLLFGHSMGGLLCKGVIAYLLKSGQEELVRKIRALCLLATPQLGSLRVPRILAWTAKDFWVLKAHGSYVTEQVEFFRNRICCELSPSFDERLHIPCWALLGREDFLVDALGAGIGLKAEQKMLVRGSHWSIVKPESVDSDSFLFIRSCLTHSLSDSGPIVSNHECSPAKLQDLPIINELGNREFGEPVSDLGLMQKWWHVNHAVFAVIHRVTIAPGVRKDRTAGYFCVIPLKGDVVKRLRNGLITGAQIPAEFVTVPHEKPEAFYIGGVAGIDFSARGSAVEHLLRHLRTLDPSRPITVLTRPVTRDGLRIAKAFSMVPVRGSGGLGEVYEGNLAELTK